MNSTLMTDEDRVAALRAIPERVIRLDGGEISMRRTTDPLRNKPTSLVLGSFDGQEVAAFAAEIDFGGDAGYNPEQLALRVAELARLGGEHLRQGFQPDGSPGPNSVVPRFDRTNVLQVIVVVRPAEL